MMVLMNKDATEEQIQAVVEVIHSHGLKSLVLPGGERTAIGIPSAIPPSLRPVLDETLSAMDGVDQVIHITRPYKLASRSFHPQPTEIRIGDVRIGNGHFVVMAGPCAVESYEQLREAALAVKQAGAQILRAGAYKPRTSPYSFQGLQREGLEILRVVAEEVGILTISEVIDPHDVEMVAEYVDILQIGARSMQNFPLLVAAGRSGKPVLLKRAPSATIDEWLASAEYLLTQGNEQVMLCERGVVPIDRTYARNTLDINAVPIIKHNSHLPIIVDPSHGIGHARYVPAVALAAVAAGADGLLIEVHPHPERALSDGAQSLTPAAFAQLMAQIVAVRNALAPATSK
ncbi:MAG: 3-deoxy-7-phosphoheptulonate synthase [Fimbriimonadales bacterium]|jgi:3-deoxy-7-phosphoheptulonate synthase|nr:3-deoxy-7-phosphoheptulonate synthase [Fimbriimonadales bacterium]GIV13746.1 MAG: 3-deoxy-7-phosphoheptulonate synthase [Fimbriimonadales bacterium]CUU04333.1 3-deoxy-D-arabinoheptulosonate-7-phosphate synthase [Armatimonadetes bacterium GBS]CUU35751.1 3-deoxy-D-arabinoheptulosonate-7-phosphate synthase [Armatimonadetes bacterium GXS]